MPDTMPPAKFCHTCEDFLKLALPLGLSQLHRSQISLPFDPRCPLCDMLDFVFEHEFWASFPPTAAPLDALGGEGSINLTSTVHGPSSVGTRSLLRNLIRIERNNSRGIDDEPAQHTSEPKSTWSLASLNQIISWLSACKESHSACNANTNLDLQLPKRLIDVDPDCILAPPTSEAEFEQLSLAAMPKVRLCETSHLTSRPQYLTLSHRWDPNPTILLTSDTLSQFSEAIPISLLDLPGSKTFADAIFVTRCLGFRYSWIDAICIDQGRDSKDELLSELAIMNQIYANGTCNISATGAKTAADGLFFEPLRARIKQALNQAFPDHAQPDAPADIVFAGDIGHFLNSAPLSTRGWVLQERMLSPRVIHFTNFQIYWECFTNQSSERPHQDGERLPIYTAGIVRKTNFATSTQGSLSVQDREQDPVVRQWQTFTEMYSQLALTDVEDKLPAMSAVARYFQTRMKLSPQDYLAGHWRNDFWFTLCWSTRDYQAGQSARYLAPSWSWASVGCSIWSSYEPPLHKLVDLVDASTVCEGHDPFGKVKHGSIRLRCHLSQALLDSETSRLVVAGGRVLHSPGLTCIWDRPLPAGLEKTSHLNSSTPQVVSTSDCWIPLPSMDQVCIVEDRFFLVPLYYCNFGFSGLILYPTAENGPFVRVGKFWFDPFDPFFHEGYFDDPNDPYIPLKDGEDDKTRYARLYSWVGGDYEKYGLEPSSEEWFRGMTVAEAQIAQALVGRLQGGNQDYTGSMDVEGRQIVEII